MASRQRTDIGKIFRHLTAGAGQQPGLGLPGFIGFFGGFFAMVIS